MRYKNWITRLMALILVATTSNSAKAQSNDNDLSAQIETLRAQGRDAEAVTLLGRVIAATEEKSGLENPMGAALLNNLGELHYKLGRYAEAIPLYERALAIADKSVKGDNPQAAITRRNLAIVYQLQGRKADAERLYMSSIAQLEKLMPATRIQLASSLNNLAILYQETDRPNQAEPILKRVLQTYRDGLPDGHPYLSTALNNLALFYERSGNTANAEAMLTAAVSNASKTLDPDHPRLAPLLQNLGMHYVRRQDWDKAVANLGQTLEIYRKQAQLGAQTREGELSGLAFASPSQQRAAIGAFVNSAMKLLTVDRSRGVDLVGRILWAAQLTPSIASASLTQMSVRRMKGDDAMTRLVRERQDLVADWQARNKQVFERLVSAKAGEGDRNNDRTQMAQIDQRIEAVDRDLAKNFPDYAALTNPQPLDVAEIQSLLRDDEALVVFIETTSPSWVWAITKTEKALSLVNLGSDALADNVAALRCGLDTADWIDPAAWPQGNDIEARRKKDQQKRFQLCRSNYPGGIGAATLPYDVGRANALYQALFNGVQKAIAGKQLLIVPSQSLTQLPFGALVTQPPNTKVPQNLADYRAAKWLGTQQAISVLPSIASLKALRRNAQPSRATKRWIGFGNPLLDGVQGDAEHERRATEARAKQSCANRPAQAQVAAQTPRAAIDTAVRGVMTDLAVLRNQIPLPETADELCDVAARLGVASADVWLGARADEGAIKALSQRDGLDDYAALHFATHGLVAGNLEGVPEPALVLTPPSQASDDNDGLLTASEVAQLKLDADWIVLSACNTAAGGREGGETLSGLARAFFYAGARSALVSHWEVNSDAAVALTTAAFAALQKDPRIGRAESMRRAQLALVSNPSTPYNAHPSVWAPFVLVGEGH